MTLSDADASEMRALFDYDPDTGELRWRVRRKRSPITVGQLAGSRRKIKGSEYIMICARVDGRRRVLMAHRVAFAWMTGRWPTALIDHRDGDGTNNRWANLREASFWQNSANRGPQKNNKVGLKGVVLERRTGRYVATITVARRRTKHLGTFETAEAAHAAYAAAARELFGEFARAA